MWCLGFVGSCLIVIRVLKGRYLILTSTDGRWPVCATQVLFTLWFSSPYTGTYPFASLMMLLGFLPYPSPGDKCYSWCCLLLCLTFQDFWSLDVEVEDLAKYNGTNTTQAKPEPQRVFTPIGRNVWFQVLYKNIAFYLFMYIIPLFTLVILSSRLARTLQKRHKNRFRMSVRRHQREDNTTFVLIIVVAVFVICQTPTPFQRFFYYIFGDEGRACGHFFFYFERFADYLAVLNSCVNFMIYVIFARGFRQNLTDMCVGKQRQKMVYRKR